VQILGRWERRPQSIYGPLNRGMMYLQLCCWKFSHEETLQQTFSIEVEIYWKNSKIAFIATL